jgi:LPS sulfotransferase NodH
MFGGAISVITFVDQFSEVTVNPAALQAYLVCATPRSGSSMLCEILRETGLAGHPLEHSEILRHSSLPRQPHEYFGDLDLDGADELLPPLMRAQAA